MTVFGAKKIIRKKSLKEYKTDPLTDALYETLDYLIEFEDIFEFPKGKYLVDSWRDWYDDIQYGSSSKFEDAEILLEYLDDQLEFDRKHPEIFEDDPQAALTLDVYNHLKRAFDRAVEQELDESLEEDNKDDVYYLWLLDAKHSQYKRLRSIEDPNKIDLRKLLHDYNNEALNDGYPTYAEIVITNDDYEPNIKNIYKKYPEGLKEDCDLDIQQGDIITHKKSGTKYKVLKPQDGKLQVRGLKDNTITHLSNDYITSDNFSIEESMNEVMDLKYNELLKEIDKDADDLYNRLSHESPAAVLNKKGYKEVGDHWFLKKIDNNYTLKFDFTDYNEEFGEAPVKYYVTKNGGIPSGYTISKTWIDKEDNDEDDWEMRTDRFDDPMSPCYNADLDDDDFDESFEVGNRVKDKWANPYRTGTVKNVNNDKVEVQWDYSDGDDISTVSDDEIDYFNESLNDAKIKVGSLVTHIDDNPPTRGTVQKISGKNALVQVGNNPNDMVEIPLNKLQLDESLNPDDDIDSLMAELDNDTLEDLSKMK